MIRMCYRCKKIMGEKEPFEDKSITSGLCDDCFPKELQRMKEEQERWHGIGLRKRKEI